MQKLPEIRDAGYWAGRMIQINQWEDDAHEDVDMFHAPSECHGLVTRGFMRDRVKLVHEIQMKTGLPIEAVINQIEQRARPYWIYCNGIHEFEPDTKNRFPVSIPL